VAASFIGGRNRSTPTSRLGDFWTHYLCLGFTIFYQKLFLIH